MGKDKAPKPYVFLRLKGDRQPKSSVITIITGGKKPSGSSPAQAESLVFNCLSETNKVQSFVHSRMTRVFTLDVKSDDTLKVKRCTLVITSSKASSNPNAKVKEKEQVSSNQVTVREANDLEVEVEPTEAPKSLEGGGQATVD